MMKNPNDIGFIHDIASLDSLRQKAVSGKEGDDEAALNAAARQFESIFTSMMLKSMRDANTHFESDLTNNGNGQFYRQMLDDQMASELSSSGSLGLADMIVAQLGSARAPEAQAAANTELRVRSQAFDLPERQPYDEAKARKTAAALGLDGPRTKAKPVDFDTPENFVSSLKPYADRAARSLGVDSSLLLAQAALETGWGQKVVNNSKVVVTTYLISRLIAVGMAIKWQRKPLSIIKMYPFKSERHSALIVAMKTASMTM
ncbi:flagellar protein FlgJ [Vibrio maritimus]|uniref:Flagellar protein FlgJ n=1 Tax=Vibrio maritimus TaxID=990268 RepID=A0A090ST66_9VIBR|nr:flagellar protein FlgJ [Vibrio maritimus]